MSIVEHFNNGSRGGEKKKVRKRKKKMNYQFQLEDVAFDAFCDLVAGDSVARRFE